MRRSLSRTFVLPAVAAVALVMAGCSAEETPSSDGSTSVPPTDANPTASDEPSADYEMGLPEGVEGSLDSPGGAGWSSDGSVLTVVIYGSSTCPWVVTAIDPAASPVAVTLEELGGPQCTMDYVPITSTITVPDELDTTASQPVRLGELGEVTVPAAADPMAFGWLPTSE